RVRRLVVDARVEAELARHVLALGWPAGKADGAASVNLRELAHDAADRAAGGGNDHGLARLRLADLQQAVPRGDAGHAAGAEIRGRRNLRRVDRPHAAR